MRTVHKFGGSSLASPEKVLSVAEIIRKFISFGQSPAVIVSAQGKTTDTLLRQLSEHVPSPDKREQDAMISCGENISAAILSAALRSTGVNAVSLTGWQSGIITDNCYSNARIQKVTGSQMLTEMMNNGTVPVITGFQGVDPQGNITTVGRGGSDLTAVVVSQAVGAEDCFLHTDVSGVYTADPKLVPSARMIPRISYDEMFELASAGSRVINFRALQIASKYQIRLWRRAAFENSEGTMITSRTIEEVGVKCIASNSSDALITLPGVSQKNNTVLQILDHFNSGGINIEHYASSVCFDGSEMLSLLIRKNQLPEAEKLLLNSRKSISRVIINPDVSSVSLVGYGLREQPGILFQVQKLLSCKKIPIHMVSTSELKLMLIISSCDVEKTVFMLHAHFELDRA